MSCYELNSIPAISQHSLKFQNTEKPQNETNHYSTISSYNPPCPGNALHFFTAQSESRNPWTGLFPFQDMFLEWLTPVPGLLPEETCSLHVLRGMNCSLADACRNAKCYDSLHQGLALKSVRRFRLLRKQTLSSLFLFWVSWGLATLPFRSSQKPGSALDPESLGNAHQLLITWP